MGRLYLRGSGISPRGKSPKFAIVGALENCKYDSVGTTLYQKMHLAGLGNILDERMKAFVAETTLLTGLLSRLKF